MDVSVLVILFVLSDHQNRRDSYLQHHFGSVRLPGRSILARRPYNDLGPCEPVRPEAEDGKDQGHCSVKKKTRSSQAQDVEPVSEEEDMGPDSQAQDAESVSQEKDTGPDREA